MLAYHGLLAPPITQCPLRIANRSELPLSTPSRSCNPPKLLVAAGKAGKRNRPIGLGTENSVKDQLSVPIHFKI